MKSRKTSIPLPRRDFLAHLAAGGAAALTMGCFGRNPLNQSLNEKPGARQNLLFLMTDQQRADSIGMVQAGVEVTPNLNWLAARSAQFTRAYTACPLCVPARTALATGVYPTRNGVVFNDWKGATAGDFKPIHQYLHERGYDVAHVGVDHIRLRPSLRERVPFALWASEDEYRAHKERRGLTDDGLDMSHFKRRISERQDGADREVAYSNTHAEVWPHDAEDFKDFFFCREAENFLAAKRNRPFALFVCLWAPHPPLIVPEPYASRFDPARIELSPNVGKIAAGEPAGRRKGIAARLAEGVSEAEWRKVWAAHLGLTNLADEGLGRLLRRLEKEGLGERTTTIFTVDHGEHLGQHAMYQKMEMHEQALRIPLLISAPGAAPRRADAPVSHLDVLSTTLDLLGFDVPKGLDGVSLAPVVRTGAPAPARPVFSQYSGNPTGGDIRRCVIEGQYKYIYDPSDDPSDAPELYDLESDPLEMQNIADRPEQRETMRRLGALCREWGAAHGDPVFQ